MHTLNPWIRLRGFTALVTLLGIFVAPAMPMEPERAPVQLQRMLVEDPSNAQVIVKFRADSSLRQALSGRAGRAAVQLPQHAATLAARLNVSLSDGRVLGPHTQVLKGSGLSSSQLMGRLAAMSDVEWAVVDERRYLFAAPNDPYFSADQTAATPAVGQWYLRAPDSTFVSAINAKKAWDISTGSSSVTVAVLDTGVRFDHPDLAGKLYAGYDFISDASTAQDGGGRDADASDPGDASTAGQCGYTVAQASNWHGTQVAGIVGAATNNGRGIAGTGRDVMVLPLRVLGRCGGLDSDIIAAMRWASGVSSDAGTTSSVTLVNAHPARVLNLSLGSQGACNAAYADVMREMSDNSVTVVVAAGNQIGLAVAAPANCPGALAVAAVRHTGTKVAFSSVGPEVALAAPGGNCVNATGACLYPIMTTTNSGTAGPVLNDNAYTNSFNYTVGTSFSAPQVAGTVGLMLSLNPALSADEIRTALLATARTFPATGAATAVKTCHAPTSVEQDECYCTTSTCGAGMLDAAAALAAVNPVPIANITVDTSALQSSNSVLLSAAESVALGDRTLAGYQWSIVSGAQYASIAGRTDGSTATLVFTVDRGTTELALVVTDSGGASATTRATVDAAQGPSDASSSNAAGAGAGGGGGGGGGSLSGLWLGGLWLACLWLWRVRWARERRISR